MAKRKEQQHQSARQGLQPVSATLARMARSFVFSQSVSSAWKRAAVPKDAVCLKVVQLLKLVLATTAWVA